MGKLTDRVALITGAARGQGRSHAVHLAREGADIIGLDLCEQIDSVPYPMAVREDLAETVRLVEQYDRRMLSCVGDVRDLGSVRDAVTRGLAEFGRLDIVLANAGVMAHSLPPIDPEESVRAWHDSVDVMLTGVWNTLQATVPVLIEQGTGGSIVITSSAAGLRAQPTPMDGGTDGYFAAKFAVVGLMKTYANALGEHNIRVNTVHPTGVATPMVMNEFFPAYVEAYPKIAQRVVNSLPVPMIEPADVSEAILYLVSESGRYVTGTTFVVDAGLTALN